MPFTQAVAVHKTFWASTRALEQDHEPVNFSPPGHAAAFPTHRRSPDRWQTIGNQYRVHWVTMVSKQARELSCLHKQQSRNEFWDQSTDGESRGMLDVSHQNSPGYRKESKGRNLPFQKENIHCSVSKPRCFKIGYNDIQVRKCGARGRGKGAGHANKW